MGNFSSIFTVFVLALLSAISLSGCQNSETIKIGYVASLSGKQSSLGTHGRDGVMLAVEQVNRNGGIDGRQVELLVKDDKQNISDAARVDKELVAQGAIAIIGHLTSSMSMVGVKIANDTETVMISPTTTTDSLTGLNDYFLRVIPPISDAATTMAQHIFIEKELKNILILYDKKNDVFCKDWVDTIEIFARKNGFNIVLLPFDSGDSYHHHQTTIKTIIEHNPDGMIMIAGAIDSALFCQQLSLNNSTIPVFATMWSMSEDFLTNGGPTVEGVTLTTWFSGNKTGSSSNMFYEEYKKRFNYSPDFSSHFSYDAAQVILSALAKISDVKILKKTILGISQFNGINEDFTLNRFGDPQRSIYTLTVKNGSFVELE